MDDQEVWQTQNRVWLADRGFDPKPFSVIIYQS
jgi:hypothetical protein